jgi:hypothetical protein
VLVKIHNNSLKTIGEELALTCKTITWRSSLLSSQIISSNYAVPFCCVTALHGSLVLASDYGHLFICTSCCWDRQLLWGFPYGVVETYGNVIVLNWDWHLCRLTLRKGPSFIDNIMDMGKSSEVVKLLTWLMLDRRFAKVLLWCRRTKNNSFKSRDSASTQWRD